MMLMPSFNTKKVIFWYTIVITFEESAFCARAMKLYYTWLLLLLVFLCMLWQMGFGFCFMGLEKKEDILF